MRRIVSAGLALFIPVTASLALSQPQPPSQQPSKQPPSKQQPNQPQPGQKQQNPQRPNPQPAPQPFRQGLPPAPRLPDRQPAPPRAQGWLPNVPNPSQRPPANWLPPLLLPPQQLLPPIPLPIDPEIGGVANLNGNWYFNGDPGKPARIVQWRLDGRAIFINENGTKAGGTVGPDSVWIPEWTDRGRPGLVGVLRGDRLIWPDGNFWSRTPMGGWFWDR